MTRTKGMAVAFYLAAAIAGVAIGVAGDRLVRTEIAPGWSQKAARDRFSHALKLTPDQRNAVENILDARNRAESTLVAPIRPQLESLRREARLKISALLTPDQQRVYEQMQREQNPRAQEKK